MKTLIIAALFLIGCGKPRTVETVQLVVVFDGYRDTKDTLTVNKPYHLGAEEKGRFFNNDVLYHSVDGITTVAIANDVKYVKEIVPKVKKNSARRNINTK